MSSEIAMSKHNSNAIADCGKSSGRSGPCTKLSSRPMDVRREAKRSGAALLGLHRLGHAQNRLLIEVPAHDLDPDW